MKRRLLSVICVCLMTFSLVACGNNSSGETGDDSYAQVGEVEDIVLEETAQPEDEAESAVDVTEEKQEEDKPDEAEPVQDSAQDETPADTGDTKPDASGQDEATSNADGTSADTASQDTTPATTDQQPAQDTAPATTDQQPVQDSTPTQIVPETNTGTSVSTANVGSTFDMENYVYNVCNANDYYIIDHQIDITFGSWFVEISTDKYNSNLAYISMGSWDYNAYYWNNNTYSYVFNFGESVRVTTGGAPECTVSKTAIALLPTLVNYMKASPDPSVAPNIPGCTFKPCQSDNPFVQY